MQRKLLLLAIVIGFAGSTARADFSYTETTRVTGGSLVKMMSRFGGKSMTEPTVSSVMIKGNRMVHANKDSVQIIDLDKQTITHVDLASKTYSVMTFAEMKEMMELARKRMEEAMKARSKEPHSELPPMDFKLDVKETGEHKTISGVDTRQVLLNLEVDMRGDQGGATPPVVAGLKINSELWKADEMPGSAEIQEFYRRMAIKADWTPNSMSSMVAQPGMGEGMQRLMKESAKLKGVTIQQISRVSGAGMPDMGGGGASGGTDPVDAAGKAATDEAQRQAASEARYEAARAASQSAGRAGGVTGSIAGAAVGGMLGGFGKKKPAPTPTPAPTSAPVTEAKTQSAPAQPVAVKEGVLLETTSTMADFSNSSIDGSKMDVPAGFKQVLNELQKARQESKQ
jgi:hypothetical protein